MNSYEDISSSKSCFEQEIGTNDESSFLEKYFHDLILDNCQALLTNTLYRTQIDKIKNKKQLETILTSYIQEQIELQQRQKIHSKYFYPKHSISIQKLTNNLKQLLIPEDNLSGTSSTLSHSNDKFRKSFVYQSDFIELFENEFLQNNREVQQGEMIYIDLKLRISNQQLKEELANIRAHLLKQLLHQTHNNNIYFQTYNDLYDLKSITVLLFVNGDVNFDFSKYFNLNSLMVGKKKFDIKLKIFYISASRLSQNFCIQNNLTNFSINQQNMAFYELKRYGQNKININKTICELQRMKYQITYSIFKDYRFYLFIFGTALVTGFMINKYIRNKQLPTQVQINKKTCELENVKNELKQIDIVKDQNIQGSNLKEQIAEGGNVKDQIIQNSNIIDQAAQNSNVKAQNSQNDAKDYKFYLLLAGAALATGLLVKKFLGSEKQFVQKLIKN